MKLFTLSDGGNLQVDVIPYGGTIIAIRVPDRNGQMGDIVLGFDTLEQYQRQPYVGALIGRYANRIARGRFQIDGEEVQLARNAGAHHLHGGSRGFHQVTWDLTPEPSALRLHYRSVDGEGGYPGNLDVSVVYSTASKDALRIDYEATTDRPTVLNLTSHPHFNLAGCGGVDISGHQIEIEADFFIPVNTDLIPTGKIQSVAGTSFDLRKLTQVADQNFDHTFVLKYPSGDLRHAATLFEPTSGRTLEVMTTEPGLHFYTGNFIPAGTPGKHGEIYAPRHGLSLEAQHFPDSPNQPAFPSTLLRPGGQCRSTTIYRFGVA